MKHIILNPLAVVLFSSCSSLVLADTRPSPQEMEKLKSALSAIGCKGGDIEKEKEGVYEVEDAKCADGRYEIEFDANYAVIKKERD